MEWVEVTESTDTPRCTGQPPAENSRAPSVGGRWAEKGQERALSREWLDLC